MTRIMVDELQDATPYPTSGHAARVFGKGRKFCHLMVDFDEHGQRDIEALHALADSIGMKRSWYQATSSPHYDLTPSKRLLALAMGAVFVPAKEQARARLERRPVVMGT